MCSRPSREGELDFGRDLPTTPEDIAALRRLRVNHLEPHQVLEAIEQLSPFVPDPSLRRTAAGWVPFELHTKA